MTHDFDLFVIGAGSGGVRAARVAAAHGAKVGIAEEHKLGGTCVVRGCIPKKLLVYGAHFAEDLKDARRFGWNVPDCSFDWPTLRENVLAEVDRLEQIYAGILENHEVRIFRERATIAGPHAIRLASGETVTARYILIATGARPLIPQIGGSEHGITSNEVFHLGACPKRVVIVGGGYIANELAGIFNEFGSEVSLINRSGEILRSYDSQLSDRLLQISTAKGIRFRFNTSIRHVDRQTDGTLRLEFTEGEAIRCDQLIFAAGRTPNSQGLGLQNAAVFSDTRGAIEVDQYGKTNVASIYAVGDVTDHIQLTPTAIREGHAVADNLFGGMSRQVDYDAIPTAVFSHPPLAAVGLTESEARKRLGTVKIFTSDFRPMKNVLAGRNERALYKMVVDASTDRVVGLHMIGPDAPEILQAAAVAVKAGLTKQAFDDTIALHPTMAEELVLLR